MKKLMIILLITAGVSISASAQHRYYGRPYSRTHVAVTVGRPYYGYYSYGYYDPFYSPYYRSYVYSPRATELDLRIEDIRADYQDRIWSAKHNDHLTKAQKRRMVHQLKYERDQAINQAKMDYYRSY